MTRLSVLPNVKAITDFTANDKIALAAVKTSMQAVTQQMAAAKQWGLKDFERLDAFTVALAHPTAKTAMLSGAGEINSHFTARDVSHCGVSTLNRAHQEQAGLMEGLLLFLLPQLAGRVSNES